MRTLVSIQALRALAALAVAACHFDQVRLMLSGRVADPQPLFNLSAGVDVFFVISGFIMVYSSELLFGTRGGSSEFLKRRLSRIVPLYWATTPLAIWLMTLPVDWNSLVGSYFFIPYRLPNGNMAPLNGVGWTLNFEMFFYSLFALSLFWRRKVAVSVLCAVLVSIIALGRWFQPSAAPFQFWSDPIILEFGAGMLIALGYRRKICLPSALRWCLLPAALIVIGVTPGQHMPFSAYRFLIWGVPAAVLVASVVLSRPRDLPDRHAAVIKLLGDASYALYLIHPLVGAIVLISWSRGLNRAPMIIVLLLALVFAQAVAIGVFKLFERPTTRALINIARRDPKLTPVAR
jgi:exopolysaccharide production protein ExoZ